MPVQLHFRESAFFTRRLLLAYALLAVSVLYLTVIGVPTARVQSQMETGAPAIVISQVYGGGGNSGATYRNDFIELFNRSTAAVDITDWSVQYASASGTTWQTTVLSGLIPPGTRYLVQQARGTGGSLDLPAPDATGTIAMGGTAGKVALVENSTPLDGGCPLSSPGVIDFVGYGGAVCFEGSASTPAPSNTTAVLRSGNGCTDSDNNGADFTTGAPNPRNSSHPTEACDASPTPTPTPTSISISSIQGSASVSPYVDQLVTTTGIVTALRSNGFFIQTPDADIDADANTSEAIFVFTSSRPGAAAIIGNNVMVTGTVVEFRPSADPNSPPLTEISGSPVVTLTSTGNALPAPITLTGADASPSASVEQLERYEGMRVRVDSLTAVSPTLGSVNEPNSTGFSNGVFYAVMTGTPRPFREPGISVLDPLPAGAPCCVPRFDQNSEQLRVDSDAQSGAVPLEVTTGAEVTNVVGVLDYAFRTYTILPDAVAPPAVSNLMSVTAVPAPEADEFTISSFNMQRFFDTTNDPNTGDAVLTAAAFENRLNKASLAIRTVLRSPDMIGVQEIENLATLQSIADKINNDLVADGEPDPGYEAHLVEGNDPGGIDVGFLVKRSRVNVIDVTQQGKDATYTNPLTGQMERLNDRPPLILRAEIAEIGSDDPLPVTVIVNHLRSFLDIDDPTDGPRVRAKRLAQAEFLANLVQSTQQADESEHIIVVGDFNAFQFNDGYADVIGTIKGTPVPADQVVLSADDLVNPDFTDLVDTLPADQRYSYVFDGNAQVLDHVLVNTPALARFSRFAYARSNADFPESLRNDAARPERLSDHDAAVAYFRLATSGPVDVTDQVATVSSKLFYGLLTHTYNGTITITNTSTATISGPLQIVLDDLTQGITLANATGTFGGDPYITAGAASLAPGESTKVSVRFRNSPLRRRIGYTTKVYAGDFQ